MRDIHKNPMLYYVLVPLLLGLWPLLVWAKYLPAAKEGLDKDVEQRQEAVGLVLEILSLAPDIINPTEGPSLGKFSYAQAVDRAANLCHIPSGNCVLSGGKITSSGGKDVQQARVKLSNVTIVQAATFLSRILSTWVNLTCDRIKLSKKQGMPDQWDIDLSFKYDF